VNTCVPTPATRPGSRSDHGVVYDPERNRILLFGGDQRGTVGGLEQPQYLDETWAFEVATQRWEKLTPPASPEPRGGFAGARAGRRWIVFGGRSGTFGTLRLHNDVWAYDLNSDSWSLLIGDLPKATNPNVPDPRQQARIVYDTARERILVFGGNSDPERFGNRVHNDLWAFDLTARSWSSVAPSSPWPGPRQSFGADVDEASGRWYLFAGARDGENFTDEVWRFDLAAGTWESFNTTGSPPPPEFARHSVALVYVPVDDRLFAFGGRDATALGRRNDLWQFDINTRSWMSARRGDTQIRAPDCRAPERRAEHAMLYIQAQRRLWLMGGESDCGVLDDLWYFGLDTGNWTNPYVAGQGETCERVAPACFGLCPTP
jgi:hypothetical protein